MNHKLNYFFTRLLDVILYPFSFIAEFWGIFFLSVLMSVLILYIYKWVSSPALVKRTKNQIKANILAIRIYKDLWRVILLSFGKSLYYTGKYFLLNFAPVLLIVPILFPVFVQMDIRYGLDSFKPGESITVKAAFLSSIDDKNIQLLEDSHFKLKMNPVFIKALNEVNWKLEILKPGSTHLRIQDGEQIFEKELQIGASRLPHANRIMNESSWAHFIYPSEPLLPAGSLRSISIHYPGKDITFAGITLNWLWWNLILVIVMVLAFKNRFGIEF